MQGGESLYIKLSLTSSERDYKMDSQSTNQLPELRNKIPETKIQINESLDGKRDIISQKEEQRGKEERRLSIWEGVLETKKKGILRKTIQLS